MKIYTKTGDKGYTGLIGGTRVLKTDARIEAFGTVDELNSFIGLLASLNVNRDIKGFLEEIQNNLFTIGSQLASNHGESKIPVPQLKKGETEKLEQSIDKQQESLPELKFFILPGGHTDVAQCHIARTVCRRAERAVVGLDQDTLPHYKDITVYLNRLSDFLFVLARTMAKKLGVEEIKWKS